MISAGNEASAHPQAIDPTATAVAAKATAPEIRRRLVLTPAGPRNEAASISTATRASTIQSLRSCHHMAIQSNAPSMFVVLKLLQFQCRCHENGQRPLERCHLRPNALDRRRRHQLRLQRDAYPCDQFLRESEIQVEGGGELIDLMNLLRRAREGHVYLDQATGHDVRHELA